MGLECMLIPSRGAVRVVFTTISPAHSLETPLSMMTTFFRDGSPLFYGLCGGAAEPMGVVTKLRRRPSWNLCQLVRATRLRHQTSNLKPLGDMGLEATKKITAAPRLFLL